MMFSNKVTWEIEADRCALLIHDMQSHYLGALPEACRRQLVANVRAIGLACLGRAIPIFTSQVAVQDARERGLMLDMWGRGPTAASQALDPELGFDGLPVRVLTKRSYSAFYGNDFEVLLRRLGRDQILIAGVYTSIGCHCSAVDAFMRDMRAFLISDATADMEPADHAKGLETAARLCARVVDTEAVSRALVPAAPRRSIRSDAIDVC
ncbi:isochorismatase family protein [Sphingobium indicum]